ncbi:restriction endonuclease [Pseudomonas fragariae (ex Marin et al. 2024)]|uniref:restriction endonuclease n=1 Tax=Pseudomonas TaxID=286 RepID=UPI00124A99C9|nr:restriction endonuclease [Pseudomonas syringae]
MSSLELVMDRVTCRAGRQQPPSRRRGSIFREFSMKLEAALINSKDSSPKLTPTEFEQHVRAMLDAMGHELLDYRSEHQELIQGVDGEYEIDVSARFSAFGMNFLVLVECKQHKSAIKRETLQILHDRMRSIGAQKGALFTTSSFQSGALKYAQRHNIATVKIVDGTSTYMTRSFVNVLQQPPVGIPTVAGWLVNGNNLSLVSADYGEALERFLFSSQPVPLR